MLNPIRPGRRQPRAPRSRAGDLRQRRPRPTASTPSALAASAAPRLRQALHPLRERRPGQCDRLLLDSSGLKSQDLVELRLRELLRLGRELHARDGLDHEYFTRNQENILSIALSCLRLIACDSSQLRW